jgi:hypothetical protein
VIGTNAQRDKRLTLRLRCPDFDAPAEDGRQMFRNHPALPKRRFVGGVSDADVALQHNTLCPGDKHRGQRPSYNEFLGKAVTIHTPRTAGFPSSQSLIRELT